MTTHGAKTAYVLLTDGQRVLVDVETLPLVTGHLWSPAPRRYAVYAVTRVAGKNVYMHRLLMPHARMIDHINHNGLDNRLANLRAVDQATNSRNSRRRGNRQYRGVHRNATAWTASATVDGVARYLGSYDSPEHAARAYDEAVRSLPGATLNFPGAAEPTVRRAFNAPRPGVRSRSGFRGVSKTPGGRYAAVGPRSNGTFGHLGTFDTAEDAAREYNRAAKQKYGDLAVLNTI